ncbi:protein IWS1 homolog [Polyodon spathula]|uniref:protein IWS1 homolog n=1 Tax=Polyodon spathula TaxID=7913 RepID=UPI001B7D91A1|nr:protein IWS1 homolog [Polyodon spathula]
MNEEVDELFSGNHSDDGGATPVQDEHEGSDAEGGSPAPRSGSEAGSVGLHSEEEKSDEDDSPAHSRQKNSMASDSENEDAPRQRGSDSEKENAPKPHDSDSEIEEDPKNQDSDSEKENAPKPHDSDSEIEEAPKNQDSDSENEAAPKRKDSDSEKEDAPKNQDSDSEKETAPRPYDSDSEIEEAPKNQDSDSENEAAPKRKDSDSENEEVPKTKGSGSENEDTPRRKRRIESDDEADGDKENVRKQKGVVSSDSEDEVKPSQADGSDSEDGEAPKRRKLADSDEEEEGEKPVKRKVAILSDSEDEEKEETSTVKKSRILSDGEESDTNQKLKALGSDSEDEEDKEGSTKDGKTLFGSDSESDNEEEKMIADIFGESGEEDEEEEFTGFNQEDLEGEKSKAEAASRQQQVAAADSDSDDVERGGRKDFMSDFDVMLARKKALGGKRRRNRDGGTFISDADDVVSAMIAKMTEAAEEDRTLNGQKKPALKKLTLLPTVVMHLKKQDLKETFIDSGVMSAIKEWIGPLPDKSLPALKIREELLRILQELPSVSQETLKHSGIGRAVMYLYKHPKESRSNKDLAGKLINEWSRPIFGLTSNYKAMTREERQQRDLDQQMPTRRRLSSGGQTPRRDLDKVLTGEEKALRPGEPGFCARARVPMPSNKDYVVRPRWNVDTEANRGPIKKGVTRVDKQMRRFADIKRLTKPAHAVKISVEGNRMPL